MSLCFVLLSILLFARAAIHLSYEPNKLNRHTIACDRTEQTQSRVLSHKLRRYVLLLFSKGKLALAVPIALCTTLVITYKVL